MNFFSHDIEIYIDRFLSVLVLSHSTYINYVLRIFNIPNCKLRDIPIMKHDKFNLNQCPKNDREREFMRNIPYTSIVNRLIHEQVCTRPDIPFVMISLK